MHQFPVATSLVLLACCLVAAQQSLDHPQSSEVPVEISIAKPEASTPGKADSTSVTANLALTQECKTSAKEPQVVAHDYAYNDCIVSKFGAYIKVDHGSYLDFGEGLVDPDLSYCESEEEPFRARINIKFKCGHLKFEMSKNDTSVFVSSLTGDYRLDGQDSLRVEFEYPTKLFEVQSNRYYECHTKQALAVRSTTTEEKKQTLFVQELALEAFRTTKCKNFLKVAQSCSLDSRSSAPWWIYSLAVIAMLSVVAEAYVVVLLVRRRNSVSSSY